MEHVDASEARRAFASLCRRAGFGHERFVIDYHGRPVAGIVSLRDLELLVRADQSESDAQRPQLANVLSTLRGSRTEFESAGVRRLAVFGSVARGTAHAESDVDILVDFVPKARIGLVAFSNLRERLASLLGKTVDLVSVRSLDPKRDAEIFSEAQYAF